MKAVAKIARAVGGWIAANIGFRELLLFAGAGLCGWGAALVWPPAGFVLPGLMLGYVSIFGVK